MADNKTNCLVGKISNSGAQHIKAPVSPNTKKGKSDVVKGQDLRCKSSQSK